MKKHLHKALMIACCTVSLQAVAQIKVDSNNDLIMNDHEIYLRATSGNKYGIGYGAFGASEMVLFSDNLIDFRQSDANRRAMWLDLGYGKLSLSSIGVGAWGPAFDISLASSDADALFFRCKLSDNSSPFYVHSAGWIYSQGDYIGSDSTLKENITQLQAPSSLTKITRLQGVSYNYKPRTTGVATTDTTAKASTPNATTKKIMAKETQERKRVGLIAQDVEKVIPDVVRTMEDGTKAISYTDLIPVIIEAMKEQQTMIEQQTAKIDSLETVINTCCANASSTKSTGKSALKSETVETEETTATRDVAQQASLQQNKPNPFSVNTTIGMYIPAQASKAMLYVYDLKGTQIQAIQVTGRGNTSVIISGNELSAGMYIYSLVIDGTLIGSKQMILTE